MRGEQKKSNQSLTLTREDLYEGLKPKWWFSLTPPLRAGLTLLLIGL